MVYKVSGLQEYILDGLVVALEGHFALGMSFKSHKGLSPYDNSFVVVDCFDLNFEAEAL